MGRDAALGIAGSALAGAVGGSGRLLLVAGEAGIGKTALVRAVAEDAALSGTRVVWASCPPGGGAPAYWPWAQVARDLAGDGALPAAVDPLLSGAPLSAITDHSVARFELYDGVSRALAESARAAPTVVVLDDLHWADQPSLDLLDAVARRLGGTRVLLVGTYRDVEAPARLDRIAAGADGLTLGGIDASAVADLVTTITATRPTAADAERLRERTGGNPLFVRELARLMVADGTGRTRAPGLPATVADTLLQRLERLSADCRTLLEVVAVADSADPGLLARVADSDGDGVFELLTEAEMARVLVDRGTAARPFAHDLFREAVLAGLGQADRRRIERSVADALVALAGTTPAPASRVAAHLVASLSPAPSTDPEDRDLAIAWTVRAAEEASARLGHEEAVRLYERCVDLAPAPSVAVLAGLGEAQMHAGVPEAASSLLAAAAQARADGETHGLVRAALDLHQFGARGDHGELLALLEEAIAAVPADSVDQALLLAALSRDRRHDYGTPLDALEPARRAVAIARGLDEPRVLAQCLLALHDATWRPGVAEPRLSIVDEMAAAAEAAGAPDLVAQATVLRAACLLESNDPRGLAELYDYCQQQEALGHARGRWEAASRRATLALITGAPAEALTYAQEAFELGQRIGIPDAFGVWGTLRWPLSLFLGSRTAIIELMVGIEIDVFRDCFIAAAHRADGDPAMARSVASTIRWPVAHPGAIDLEFSALGADALAAAGPTGQVRACYDDLLPHAGTNVLVGGCASYWGPVDLYLGELAGTLGDRATARRHLGAAEAMATALGATLWAKHAGDLAAALGPADDRPLLERDGRVWRVGWRGTVAHVADSKGMRDLATLLTRPGEEVAATTLMAGRATSYAEPVLDAHAKAAYRHRIDALEEEIDDAVADGNDVVAERARVERTALIHELASAVGLGGRDRRLGDDQERARKAVSARIRDAISRIGETHPQLGDHLACSVRTGSWCSYRPEGTGLD